jgi:hypothetical protein
LEIKSVAGKSGHSENRNAGMMPAFLFYKLVLSSTVEEWALRPTLSEKNLGFSPGAKNRISISHAHVNVTFSPNASGLNAEC